jgi:hypothetical protein
MILRPEIAERVFNSTLMMDPGKAAAILHGIGGRIVEGGIDLTGASPVDHTAFAGGRPSDAMGRLGNQMSGWYDGLGETLFKVGMSSVIPIEGTLVHKGKYLGSSSGAPPTRGCRPGLARRARSDRSAAWCSRSTATAARRRRLRHRGDDLRAVAEKPTLAILTDFAFSAGYLLASRLPADRDAADRRRRQYRRHHAARRLFQAAGRDEGIKVTVLSSGKFKAEGNPFAALPEKTAANPGAASIPAAICSPTAVGTYRGTSLTKAMRRSQPRRMLFAATTRSAIRSRSRSRRRWSPARCSARPRSSPASRRAPPPTPATPATASSRST